MSETFIPPEYRALFGAFWERRVAERYGDLPPTRAERRALIQEYLDAGVPTVPLPGGGEVTLVSDAIFAEPPTVTAAGGADERATVGLRRNWFKVGLLLLALAFIVVMQLAGGRRDAQQPGESAAHAAPAPQLTAAPLPATLDDLIASGDVRLRGDALLPRTLELAPADGSPSVTFAVVPVQVTVADWPCPVQGKWEGQPGACWVMGTVVNYLIGIPATPEAEALFARLQLAGGEARLRLSTQRLLSFQVREVVTLDRQQTEVLAQRRFGLTAPLLNQVGGRRLVLLADYDPASDLGGVGTSIPPQQTVFTTLGELVTVGPWAITPLNHQVGVTSRLTLRVVNHGAQTLRAADWRATATLREGGPPGAAEVSAPELAPNATGMVTVVVSGAAQAWQVVVQGWEVVIQP